MSRKKWRNIVVEGKQYRWLVGNVNCDGDGGAGFIILEGRAQIYRDVITHIMMPKEVSEIIKKLSTGEIKKLKNNGLYEG